MKRTAYTEEKHTHQVLINHAFEDVTAGLQRRNAHAQLRGGSVRVRDREQHRVHLTRHAGSSAARARGVTGHVHNLRVHHLFKRLHKHGPSAHRVGEKDTIKRNGEAGPHTSRPRRVVRSRSSVELTNAAARVAFRAATPSRKAFNSASSDWRQQVTKLLNGLSRAAACAIVSDTHAHTMQNHGRFSTSRIVVEHRRKDSLHGYSTQVFVVSWGMWRHTS